MKRRVGTKLAVLLLLVGSLRAEARTQYCGQFLAPADGQTLPANARQVIAMGQPEWRRDPVTDEQFYWRPWISKIDVDGGVHALEALPSDLQPVVPLGDGTVFELGALVTGERFRLESSRDCSFVDTPKAELLVVDPAPLPSALGTVFSPPSFRLPDRHGGDTPFVSRDLFLDLDESVRPWLSVARVNLDVNGRTQSTPYGRLARDPDGGQVFVERLSRNCSDFGGPPNDTLQTWMVKLELEIPGFTERPPPVEFAAEIDCRPSCASTGVGPWLLAVFGLARRRRVRSRTTTSGVADRASDETD